MGIYFCNHEPIDLNAIAVMGVSVKTGASPIGFFGTGLKFALATLLRSGCTVKLIRAGEEIPFTVQSETIRGEQFDRVVMAGEKLGFTTKLGRTWEPWQAYRELACNAMDEGGVISDTLPSGCWGTIFAVDGEAIESCHRSRHEIFLTSRPISDRPSCEIHTGQNSTAFYRGVKAHKHSRLALFTYNIKATLDLTEDRTVKHGFMVEHYAQEAIVNCDDESVIEQALMAPQGTFEHGFSYSSISDRPSLAFMDVAFRMRQNLRCNRNAIKLWEQHADARLTYSEVGIDAFEQELLDRALALTARLGASITRHDFFVVDGLGDGIYGAVRGSRILISRAAFDMGHRFLASTLYEEWLHKQHQYEDESRGLQNLLFEKLFSMVERVCSMEQAA